MPFLEELQPFSKIDKLDAGYLKCYAFTNKNDSIKET